MSPCHTMAAAAGFFHRSPVAIKGVALGRSLTPQFLDQRSSELFRHRLGSPKGLLQDAFAQWTHPEISSVFERPMKSLIFGKQLHHERWDSLWLSMIVNYSLIFYDPCNGFSSSLGSCSVHCAISAATADAAVVAAAARQSQNQNKAPCLEAKGSCEVAAMEDFYHLYLR